METYRKKIESNPDLTLVDVYGDLGRSGTQIKGRNEFQRMMKDCRDGKIDLIYCKSISRFGRNMENVLASIRELQKLHVRVIFEKEGLDTKDQQSEIIFGIMATIAEEESRSIAENLHWGRKARLKKGRPYGEVSYGYREKKDHTWVIYEPEAERVRTAFRMALDHHNYTPYYTGSYISNKTIETVVGGKGKVRRDNSGERGQFIIENHHEPLISKEDFETVEELVKTKALFTPRNWRKLHGKCTDQKTAEPA